MGVEKDSQKELHYVLAQTPEEAERLHQQSILWAEATERVLDKIRLTKGMSCLDLGCGAGDMMVELGSRVGLSGSVLGVDTDSELGHHVVTELNQRNISRFSFLNADVTAPETMPTELFDVTTARFLLLHLSFPRCAILR